ncbi:unnamed protein product [Rotaria sp. Silwood2]|nr:unnamed protein product [Rotaria sp. Silwood2]CAF2571534.1 unnamed protein product [Rotaria sp. Silwood2]CAF2816020.1 unnamed protein product [Rotaria sp. Silwood2]CAF3978693.1 unnamed protein product [Rotaria sp. Silwood2]CAF4060005.1 unnamed protein product [Rotaria sp. Silwood2]
MKFLFILINLCIGYQANLIRNTNFSTVWTNFTQDLQLSHATYSITILDNSTGNIIFSFNKDVGLAPASTLKTVTGAAALHYLGTDYRYKTFLEYSGRINSFGFLNGYIYIVGSGDPSLGSWRWNETAGEVIIQRWLNLIAKTGIKNCRGIVLDLSAWPSQTQTVPSGYTWGDIGNYYGAGSSALNWRENQFHLILSPGLAVGDPVTLVYIDHPPPSVIFINELITGPPGSGELTSLYLAPDGTYGYLRGSLGIDSSKNVSIGGAIPNSALYIADELRQGMGWSNVTSIKIIYQKEINATKRTTLDIYQSPPMSEIVYWFEQSSINMYGEVLVKTIAQMTNSSINSVLPVYCETVPDIEQTAVATMDGSGLSPENRITTWAIARVLYDVRQRASWFSVFEHALPTINGIRMKSGYIHNVLSYAGYVNHQVFSIITNNFNGQTSSMRQKIWNLLDTLK